ncbi:MAG TPA: hypothetical protein VF932_11000 [Anaerolineae bacterium]
MNRKFILIFVVLVGLALIGLAGWSSLAMAQGATATITAPVAGDTVGGTLPITGTATGPNFAYFLVQFKLGDQWTLVDGNVHTTPVTATATLASWDTTKYADAAYDLRLLVADKSGQFITATVSIKVDNTKTPKVVALPSRGCTSCHVQIAPDGRYTIAWEAMNADSKHPALPNGFKTAYQDCMVCHAVKGTTGIAGVVAPLTMRAILHPAHMMSDIFVGELKGNCFSCHEVDNGGNFTVLPEKVNVNQHGVQTSP